MTNPFIFFNLPYWFSIKKTTSLLQLLFLIALTSCEEYIPEVTFESEIEGRETNLSNQVLNPFYIQRGEDTLKYILTFDDSERINYLIRSDTDTVFMGSITKRNELFLLNRELENGNFAIHALKFTDSSVTGLETEYDQGILMQAELNSIETIAIEKDTSNNKSLIDIDKKNAKRLFRSIIEKLTEERFVNTNKEFDTELNSSLEIDSTISVPLIKKIYPNPFKSTLKIDMTNSSSYKGVIINQQGVISNTFEFNSISFQLNLPQLTKGSYFLKIIETKTNRTESVNVLKI